MKPVYLTIRVRIVIIAVSLFVSVMMGCTTRSGSSQAPAGPLDFIFVNNSGLVITSIYVSPHDIGDWQENILGGDLLRTRERVSIRFDRRDQRQFWDIKVEDRDGTNAEFKNLDLQRVSRLTLRLRSGVAFIEAE